MYSFIQGFWRLWEPPKGSTKLKILARRHGLKLSPRSGPLKPHQTPERRPTRDDLRDVSTESSCESRILGAQALSLEQVIGAWNDSEPEV